MTEKLYALDDDPTWFPPIHNALSEPPGLLAVGGDLSVERITNAYQRGIFPWYSTGEPIMWWSPDPRAVLIPSEIRINKSLKKFLKKHNYTVTFDQAFEDVIQGCAEPRVDDGTWIFPEMIEAYCRLYKEGIAHSIEVWQITDGERSLVGGLYGVLTGLCFSGESMFSRQPNASKVALIALAKLLGKFEDSIIDCQIANPYLMSMGAKTVSRDWFLEKLSKIRKMESPLNCDWSSFN